MKNKIISVKTSKEYDLFHLRDAFIDLVELENKCRRFNYITDKKFAEELTCASRFFQEMTIDFETKYKEDIGAYIKDIREESYKNSFNEVR